MSDETTKLFSDKLFYEIYHKLTAPKKEEINKLNEELDKSRNLDDFVSNLKGFVANETGNYYINMQKGEKLYKEDKK